MCRVYFSPDQASFVLNVERIIDRFAIRGLAEP
jgi:hypothetical protein